MWARVFGCNPPVSMLDVSHSNQPSNKGSLGQMSCEFWKNMECSSSRIERRTKMEWLNKGIFPVIVSLNSSVCI